ncbi:MAG: metallophosphoesterase family protein [Candidatus Micrarchaeota archaeon]|nr:metallophosphoesterase family protein [Candidatus Micrarchaeota archaeon]
MKVAILGDFHFGYDRFYDDSFVQAEQALLRAQDEADLLIVAGDIFDSRTPKQEVIARAIEIFRKLHKKVIVIHGTHERRPQGFANPVDILVKAGLVESCHAHAVVVELGGEKVAVYGMGGVPEEYAKAALERLAPKPVEGAFNIFMFHQNLKELMPQVENGLTMDDLPQGFQLYVDGHLHKSHFIEKGGRILLIPGSTVLTQVRREEKVKGFYVYDTATRKHTYVSIPSRAFIHTTIHIGNNTSFRQLISERLSQLDLTGHPIVRIDVEGDVSGVAQSEVSAVRDQYAGKCHLFVSLSRGTDAEEMHLNDVVHIGGLGVSIRERGISILKEAAARRGVALGNVEEAFEMMCEADDSQLMQYFINASSNNNAKK